ncbi:family 78 glycoside hydrolase catalytic domain [Ruficoccus amylovorans]|uniref:alpha-L-rhamnosidase n=1 Tax=Ruficoccus amylovorans TaxID=1804625 RepID=A0A842HCI1_9BACT|nr:alpha-L-rhamnosidase [Ruficoccus amylovorans]MBC2593960.1 family 78 glycoside hydrolase catalytic domain [Ruficoccus amylovorans]
MKKSFLTLSFVTLSFVTLTFFYLAAESVAALEVGELRCSGLPHALIDTPAPSLSWELKSDRRGVTQEAYRVVVASSPERLAKGEGDLWDSGWVSSDQSLYVRYEGAPLAPMQRGHWKVRVKDNFGEESDWSAPESFERGLPGEADWQRAAWITWDETAPGVDRSAYARSYHPESQIVEKIAKDGGNAGPHLSYVSPLMRREFSVPEKKVSRATAYVAGLGYHEFYLNGERLGDNVLSPTATTYDREAHYVAYDLTERLRTGDNVIGLWLGSGFWGQSLVWSRGKGLAYGPPMARVLLRVEYTDGTSESVRSDRHWLAAQSPVVFDNVYWGETYDARLEKPGWSQPGYDAADWSPIVFRSEQLPERLIADDVPPIRRLATLEPVSIQPGRDGTWILDFGKNIAGWVRVRMQGEEGQRVSIRVGEMLMKEGDDIDPGSTGFHPLGFAQECVYISNGQEEVWEPRFMYHGFRYAVVDGLKGKPEPGMFEAVQVATAAEPAGTFTSSDELLNRIYATSVLTIQNSLHGLIEDCPTREKCVWLGDVHALGEAALYSLRMDELFRKFNRDVVSNLGRGVRTYHGTSASPGIPTNVATGKRYISQARPDWGAAVVLVPWYQYLYRGDISLAERHYPEMKRWVEYVEGLKQDGFVTDGFGDWCPPGSARNYDTPVEFTSSAYHFYTAEIMAWLAEELNYGEDAADFARLAETMKTALIDEYWQKDTGGYATQTANALALRMGLYPQGGREACAAALAREVNRKGYYYAGILGARSLFTELSRGESDDLAVKLLRQTTYPSYGYMLENGSTTWPESLSRDRRKPGQRLAGGSQNHPMQAGFVAWFYEAAGGLQPLPDEPGFRSFILKPYGYGSLEWVRVTHHSPYGEILSSWRVEDDVFDWDVEVPANTSAFLYVPSAGSDSVRESGHAPEADGGVQWLRREGDRDVFRVGSGRYHFTATLK